MTTNVPAIFDDGVFRPETPVSLPAGTRVTLTVSVEDEERKRRREAVEQLLRTSKELNFNSGGDILTRDQLHERR